MHPTPETDHPPVEVEPTAHAGGVCLRLGVGTRGEILLSIDQARALSLALIAAVNHQERGSQARRPPLARSAQPSER